MKTVFLATPYSSSFDDVRRQHLGNAARMSATLMELGYNVLCPAILRAASNVPDTPEFWNEREAELIKRCDAVVVNMSCETWREDATVARHVRDARASAVDVWHAGTDIDGVAFVVRRAASA